MEHIHSRVPYAQWRLRVFRQLFHPSVSSKSTFLSRRVHSTGQTDTDAHKNFDTTTTKAPDNHKKASNNDTAKSKTPPSQLLPQSPLLTNPNPGRVLRHRKKRQPTGADTADLSRNPWAMALASPVRQCNLTGARLPKDLLSEWGLVEQPIAAPEPEATPDPNSQPPEQQASKLWLLPTSLLNHALEPSQKQTSGRVPPQLKLRMVNRMPLLEALNMGVGLSRKQKHTPLWPLLPMRWKHPLGPLVSSDELRIIWRGDMPNFALRMIRRETLMRLKRASDKFKRHDRPIGKPNRVWRSIDVQSPYTEKALLEGLGKMEAIEGMERGAVLILGDGSASDAGAGEETALPDLVTLPGSGSKVPVFDLTRLLSQAELEELRAYHGKFQLPALFLMPPNELVARTILALWRLQGYVKEPL
ncbi:hypothetical protein BDV12DRAFT_165299 [Aspergillus spectabilis]